MNKEIPDGVLGAIGAVWDDLGYNPVLIYRLLNDRQLPMIIIDGAMREIVGTDWSVLKAGEWCDRIAAKGDIEMIRSLETDELPVLDILNRLILEWWRAHPEYVAKD